MSPSWRAKREKGTAIVTVKRTRADNDPEASAC